jgi:hypothetical protein
VSVDVETLDRALLVGAAVLGLAFLAVRLSAGGGLPSVLAEDAAALLQGFFAARRAD